MAFIAVYMEKMINQPEFSFHNISTELLSNLKNTKLIQQLDDEAIRLAFDRLTDYRIFMPIGRDSVKVATTVIVDDLASLAQKLLLDFHKWEKSWFSQRIVF